MNNHPLYINIHTHKQDATEQVFIENLYKDFDQVLRPGYWSAGLHPWFIATAEWEHAFKNIEAVSTERNLVAIGECGLDRVCETDFTLQQQVFTAHIVLANTIKKPIIVHCVRAYDEVISLLKKQRNKVPVIFHGFNKNADYMGRLLAAGYYLSFGESILQSRNADIFKTVTDDRFFLETDDSAHPIQEIYAAAAKAKALSTEALSLQLEKNLQTVFNINI